MKKITYLLLAVLLCASIAAPVSAVGYGEELNPNETVYEQEFYDVPTNHWAFEFISELVERGAVSGYPDGRYYPDNTVTRAQFATIMVMAAGLTPTPVTRTGFADLPADHWGAPYVETAKQYMTSYRQSNGQYFFKPENAALREDVAVAVVKLKGYDTSLADVGALQVMFSDFKSISESIRPYIAVAVEKGVISGYPDGTFRGQDSVTRAEAAAILWRAFQYGNDDKVVADNPVLPQTQTKPQTPTQPTEEQSAATTQYVTETLATFPSSVDDYVFTQEGDVYYLKDNKLFLVSGGKTTQLFDGNTDFYEEITADQMVANVHKSNNLFGYSYFDEYQQGENENILYYDKFFLSSLAYEQASGNVFVVGTTNTQRIYGYPSAGYVSSGRIYNASNMDEPFYSLAYVDTYDDDPPRPTVRSFGRSLIYRSAKIDLSSGVATDFGRGLFGSDSFWYKYIQLGGDIIQVEPYEISKLNLATAKWVPINLVDNTLYEKTAVCAYQDQLYYATGEGVFYLAPAGTNRMKGVKVFAWEELTIADDVPMGKVSNMLFDDNGNIVFADESHSLIRKITIS